MPWRSPAAYAVKGNYTYLMLAIGSILARFVIGIWFVPAYYRKEIYSPYEFMGQKLGPTVDRVSTGIFLLGGFLAQGSRLFLAALVLDTITGMGISWAVLSIAATSLVWTWLGGINSVVWTDVVQFIILIVGGIVALVSVVIAVPGGVPKTRLPMALPHRSRDDARLRLPAGTQNPWNT